MKGKTLEKLEFFTTPEYHSFTLDFTDRTSLTLKIEPCFILQSTFFDVIRGNQKFARNGCPSTAPRTRTGLLVSGWSGEPPDH
jgi:hypothetical protein